ncbi:MAG: malonic semialdehyde reductase [Caulobacteraceae bacterium]
MSEPLDAAALARLFRDARTRNAWKSETLPDSLWRELYDLVKFGPTSLNTSPARFVFVTSDEGKARLKPHLSEGNYKALAAPCIAIIAQDTAFYDHMPELFPTRPKARDGFVSNPARSESTALRNATLQGGYLILAARALGLDCGPMGGFDNAGVDAAFLAGGSWKSNFLCALGHGADTSHPRLPRLSFETACQIV